MFQAAVSEQFKLLSRMPPKCHHCKLFEIKITDKTEVNI